MQSSFIKSKVAITAGQSIVSPQIGSPQLRAKKSFEDVNVRPGSPVVVRADLCSDIVDSFSGLAIDDCKIEGNCLLKTKSDRFKEHWVTVVGKDLLCYRRKGDTEARVMHCLTNTFVVTVNTEQNPENGSLLYPVKLNLPGLKSRILYFSSSEQ